jgi:hypothetical protein
MARHNIVTGRAVRGLMLAALGTLLLSGLGGCAVTERFSGSARCGCGPELVEFIAWCAVYFGAHWAQGCR